MRWVWSAFLLVFPLGSNLALAQSPEAKLSAALDRLRGPAHQATYTLKLVRPDLEKTYVLQVWTDGERALVRVVAPAQEAGQAFLHLGDDLYLYDPRLGRTLKLPPTGRSRLFLGSDVSYQDLAGRDWQESFTVREEKGVLVLLPKPEAPTPYGRVEIHLEADLPRRVVYFDQRGTPVREIRITRYQEVAQRPMAVGLEVLDLLNPGHKTLLSVDQVRVGAVPERCFTLAALERGC